MANSIISLSSKKRVANSRSASHSVTSGRASSKTLADLGFKFPQDVYPVGRLDNDSEGLLILTNDKSLNHQLLNPDFAHSRVYAVQVDGQMTEEGIQKLENGIDIKLAKKVHHTMPAKAKLLPQGIGLAERRRYSNPRREWSCAGGEPFRES